MTIKAATLLFIELKMKPIETLTILKDTSTSLYV